MVFRALPFAVATAAVANIVMTVAPIIRAFDTVAVADPSEKARNLANGISEAMNCYAFGLVVLAALCGLLGVLHVLWQVRWRGRL